MATKHQQIHEIQVALRALSDETRLRIFALLIDNEVCVCHIHDSLQISQPKASRHLAYLKRSGLVTDRKDGLWVHYRLTRPSDRVLETLLWSVAHCLTHVDQIARDRERLNRITGCCPPVALPAPAALGCCGLPTAGGPESADDGSSPDRAAR